MMRRNSDAAPVGATGGAIRVPQTEDTWQRTLWAMVGIQFVMTAAINFLSPIIPLMLPELGVTSPEGVDIWAGVITGSTSFVAAFASPVWGRVADRYGRKQSLLRSSFAIAIFTALMGLATNVWAFFGARAVMGAFAGFSSSAIALVASQVPERRLGFALGWLATGQLVGSLIGPVVGGVLADLTGSYRAPFFATGAITLVALALVWAIVHEDFTPLKTTGKGRSLFAGLKLLTGSSALIALFVVLLMAQFSVRTVQPVVTLFVQQLVGSPPQLATLAGVAFSITGLADLVSSPFLGKRSDVIGYRKVLLICLAGATLTSAPQVFAGQLLDVRGRAVRGRAVHRRYPADGECPDRAQRVAGDAWHRLRNDRISHLPGQFARSPDRRRHRGRAGTAVGIRRDHAAAGSEPGLGVADG